jgi:signal transduction histidine kinase
VSNWVDITMRKRVEESARKEQRLLREMLDLQDRDRKLIAYEIHDGLAQQLTGAVLQLQALGGQQDHNSPEAAQIVENASRLLQESLRETRRLISGLRPPALDEGGIVPAIESLVAERQRRDGPEIELVTSVRFDRLAAPLETAAFRIVQESLTNACRYSRSDKVRVTLAQDDEHLRLEIQDWGVGFDPSKVSEGHFGLKGIIERARLLGGSADIDAAPGKGVYLVVVLPLIESVAE